MWVFGSGWVGVVGVRMGVVEERVVSYRCVSVCVCMSVCVCVMGVCVICHVYAFHKRGSQAEQVGNH